MGKGKKKGSKSQKKKKARVFSKSKGVEQQPTLEDISSVWLGHGGHPGRWGWKVGRRQIAKGLGSHVGEFGCDVWLVEALKNFKQMYVLEKEHSSYIDMDG